uniref:Galanin receptor 1 n=1 Tax=Nothobranchius furzeri TaxID=105023 RepID=A0A1A8UG22_NOTFU
MNLSESVWVFGEPWNLSMVEEEEQQLLFGIGTDNFITLLVFGLIFTLGVLGNSMVITVLARSKPGKPRSTTNIFILNLSVADLSYLLFCVPFQSTIYMLPTWILGAFICKFIHFFFTVSMLVSIFTLSAMSVDRYVAIVHARKASWIRVGRHATLGVVLIWILSVGMAAPVAHYQNLVEREDNSSFCWEVWPDRHRRVYVMCSFVFGYLLPLALISVCYMKVSAHGAPRARDAGIRRGEDTDLAESHVIYEFKGQTETFDDHRIKGNRRMSH